MANDGHFMLNEYGAVTAYWTKNNRTMDYYYLIKWTIITVLKNNLKIATNK